jgi:hypothetical protein
MQPGLGMGMAKPMPIGVTNGRELLFFLWLTSLDRARPHFQPKN